MTTSLAPTYESTWLTEDLEIRKTRKLLLILIGVLFVSIYFYDLIEITIFYNVYSS